MAVRGEVVRRKLLEIAETVGRLRSWLPLSVEQLERDFLRRWAVERGLNLTARAVCDTGDRILVREVRELVDEYRAVPACLAAGVICWTPWTPDGARLVWAETRGCWGTEIVTGPPGGSHRQAPMGLAREHSPRLLARFQRRPRQTGTSTTPPTASCSSARWTRPGGRSG